MPPAKAALLREQELTVPPTTSVSVVPPRLPNVIAGPDRHALPLKPVPARPPVQKQNGYQFQPRVPVITGEAIYRGSLPVNGIISGQMNGTGGGLTIKQRPRNGRIDSQPELDGELSFKDMLRINGHVRGRVSSERGTLIVDASAIVDAAVEVGVAIVGGVVNGDLFASERVELGPSAVINGNISTPSLTIKPGATFHGECRMLKSES